MAVNDGNHCAGILSFAVINRVNVEVILRICCNIGALVVADFSPHPYEQAAALIWCTLFGVPSYICHYFLG
jgi:hypothetical protein